MFQFIYNLKYRLQPTEKAICILNCNNKMIFANKKYKQLVNNKKIHIFEYLEQESISAKQLYCLKNESLLNKVAIGEFLNKRITILTKKTKTIWFIEDLKQTKSVIDVENLPMPVIELNQDKSIKTANKLFLNLFVNNEAIFTEFFQKINNSKNKFELELQTKIIKLYVKQTQEYTYIISFTEITKQKVLEQEVKQSQKMQAVGQLAGGIAHDFNNILTAIIMSCDFLLDSHRSSDPSHPDLMIIKQNANRAAALVQQLLAFSRRQTLQVSICNIANIVADTKVLVERLMGTNINFKVYYSHNIWHTKLDKDSFQRVLMNLLINAKDAIGKNKGNITVNVQNVEANEVNNFNFDELEHKNYVLVQISDSGAGISESVKEKIFEPFFTTKEVGKGTGLGLAMVYGIVKQLGGFIKCDSIVGEGTNFLIFLPANAEQNIEISNTQSIINEDLSGFATILLVDDEDIVRKSFARALKSRGYEVLEAANGQEALNVFEQNQDNINIIISDVVMPVMDGPSFYAELSKFNTEVKFVFISGYTKDAFAAKYNLEEKDFFFLSKPISLKELATKIKEIQ